MSETITNPGPSVMPFENIQENFRPNVDLIPTEEVTARYKNLGKRATELLVTTYFDELTGLANEKMFNARLSQCMERENQSDIKDGEDTDLALFYIDVDAFKSVNDTLGHEEGDKVLQLIGQTLRSSIRSTDLAAVDDPDGEHKITSNDIVREHGDEFKLLIPKVTPDNPKVEMSPQERLEAIKTRLRIELDNAIEGSPHAQHLVELGVGISIGSVVYKKGETPEEFTRRADNLMRYDKRQGNKQR